MGISQQNLVTYIMWLYVGRLTDAINTSNWAGDNPVSQPNMLNEMAV